MRYQFQSPSGGFSFRPKIFTDAIKMLVTVNFAIFFLQYMSGQDQLFFKLFGLVPKDIWSSFMIWQPISYLFFHGSIWHVLINMFVLWMFGSELERIWGKERFLKYYFITGIGSGLVTFTFNINSTIPVVGASGAVYGVLLAYGLMYPNRTIYLYGILPIKSIWFVVGIGIIAFFSSFSNATNISHMTHLSGMLIGFVFLRSRFRFKDVIFSIRKQALEYQIHREEKHNAKQKQMETDINQILEKINEVGFDKLSQGEKDKLFEGSKSLHRDKKKD
ncbi:MAG: rhomboid family intramembrane serine protease [Candidatus Marinimicrobia bacterium]|jgi:membrane associated rhomboid family serine protease|nr:rhomboid family intramembrane serine protease [Candidatus Neomarinimicrobiota bacterium]MBT3495608.1 rhomboid family intramembrane serine protease [Candidatus Neomarinimicrobiota bacterium]MBT3692563.1 rhomboid family intramembrane serine protease [Candidatus Neomarinimicrobiota bacterium]MBT3732498.1 rhomboid family intramembrane serine protease [Candidatus Neomarinimicrobiota bacterium]MBT4144611.1 rhomboid family intramembrane serine protease [Candidatus Neomarinimicrobiota bacterium]